MAAKTGRFVQNSFLCFAALLIVSPAINSVQADVISLEFSGTYDTNGQTVFGLSGSAVPFDYTMTYDTSLNTNSLIIPAGAIIDAYTYADSFYGYSVSGITALNLTFGSQTWTATDIIPRVPAGGYTADIWFNTDLSTATPTRTWLVADISSPDPLDPCDHVCDLQIGGAFSGFENVVMFDTRSFVDDGLSPGGVGKVVISSVPESVPEPKTSVMMITALGLLGLVGVRRVPTETGKRRQKGTDAFSLRLHALASNFRFMPRRAGVIVPGIAHRVTQRGNNRQQVFYFA